MKINPIPLENINDIDLDSNLIIEASAGTGKTYTIENLVLNLLKSDRVTGLENILIVTFTEKATSELRQRIRDLISESLEEEYNQRLEESLHNFDSASIQTIHGFCHKVLQSHAFENREHFQLEVVEDKPLYRTLLHTIMREEWPKKYGTMLSKVLVLSDYPKVNRGSEESFWEKRVISIAMKFMGENDTVYPEKDSNFLHNIKQTETEIIKIIATLSGIIGNIDSDDFTTSYFYKQYEQLNINTRSIGKRIRTIILPTLDLISEYRENGIELPHIINYFNTVKLDKEKNFQELNEGWKKTGPDFDIHLPELEEIIKNLESLRQIDLKNLARQLEVLTIYELHATVSAHKRAEGLISYNDMISLVSESLSNLKNPLNRELQKKYTYAIVDEFQDTDKEQWKIFQSIFLQGERHRLFVIGDPKQAIYGFRGADIAAYYNAKQEMIENCDAKYYTLHHNYRSVPNLINGFNQIFSHENWFGDTQMDYFDSQYPDTPQQQIKLKSCMENSDNLNIVDLGESTGSVTRQKMSYFIGYEIARLLHDEGDIIEPRDIAILVRKWNEADTVEKSLQEFDIPYAYYKKSGLFQSKEALSLVLVLKAITHPGDEISFKKALLTDFFRINIENIQNYENLPSNHNLPNLYKDWNSMAINKDWPRLFQSIMEESSIYDHADISESSMNMYNQIIQHIISIAYRKKFSIFEITDYLYKLYYYNEIEEDQNLTITDPDSSSVQLMTIHSSKGLQFKVVFIAGGFTSGGTQDFWTYHHNGKRTYDIAMENNRKYLFLKEQKEEEKRLFYVALTRAIYKLYIPTFTPKSKHQSGIIGLELKESISNVTEYSTTKIIHYDSLEIQNIAHRNIESKKHVSKEIIFPDELSNFFNRRIMIESFSHLKDSLSAITQNEKIETEFGDPTPILEYDVDSLLILPSDEDDKNKNEDLPPGINTGLMIHEILEHIDFNHIAKREKPEDLLCNQEIELLSTTLMKYYNTLDQVQTEHYLKKIAQMIWSTLHTKIPVLNAPLCEIVERLNEVEFFTHLNTTQEKQLYYKNILVHGFIDMIFKWDGKYYILDWKTNFINEGYEPDILHYNIETNHYDLQYKIYSIAAYRWLNRYNDFIYDKNFGGILYLYLRGMNIKNPHHGVYFYHPGDVKSIHHFEDELIKQITSRQQ